tara:strand:+ start:3352 stop:4050 length:699 start_codon:yes stop_codon:yes gene_type:complete
MTLDNYRTQLQSQHLTYSQCLQDAFALSVNKYKFGGICVDVGCSTPTQMYSNSKLLQLYKWKCIGADIGNLEGNWNNYPYFKYLNADCTKQESIDLIFSEAGNNIDFLSLDIDDYTVNALRLIDFNKVQTKCICIEHNKYLGARGEQRHEQREILKNAGYTLLVKNFHGGGLEDWWINTKLVNYDDFKHFSLYSEKKFEVTTNLEEILPNHQNNINRDKPNFDIQTLQNLTK